MKNLLSILCFAIVLSNASYLQAQSNVRQDSIPKPNRHDFVGRGTHPNELKLGDYVVVGTALSEKDANLMVKQFKKLKYPTPSYAYLTIKSLWYIYYGSYTEIEEAKLKRDEYRKYKMYQNAYLLTVHQ
jgi:hypothetical protein